jgi:hypothetical protein
MSEPPLDDRHRGAIDATSLQTIAQHLKRRERGLSAGVATMLVIGIPMLLLGPLILGTLFWFATGMLLRFYPWSWFFWGFVVVLIPLLFWTERGTRGTYFADTVVAAGGASPLPYLAGAEIGMLVSFATSPRVAASGFVELFLTGPRLVLDAIDKIRRARHVRDVDRDRAAHVVARLRQFDQGIAPDQINPGEPVSAVIPVLAYLLFHDWIGISKTGDRVWLLGDARRALYGR